MTAGMFTALDGPALPPGIFFVRQLPLVGDDAARPAADAGVGADERAAVLGAVLVEALVVDDAREQLDHVVLLVASRGEDLVDVVGLSARPRRPRTAARRGRRRHVGVHERPRSRCDARVVVGLAEVDRAGDLGVHGGAAELLAVDLLADRRLHQRRPGQVQPAALGHEQRVAQHGQVAAAGDAVAHDRGDLGDALRADDRVVAEDAAEVVGVGEDVLLQRQEHAGGVDEVDQRQASPVGDRLAPG